MDEENDETEKLEVGIKYSNRYIKMVYDTWLRTKNSNLFLLSIGSNDN